MEENEDAPADVRLATPVEDEIKKAEEPPKETSKLQKRRVKGDIKKRKKENEEEDCCENKKRMKKEKELQWGTIHVFENECKLPKPNIVPRHCLSKKEHLDMLATPRRKCESQCLKKPVTRKLKPIPPRIEELAKPPTPRILRTIEDRGDTLAPEILDNLIKMVEAASSLSPEQAAQLFHDNKSRSTKKCKKKKNKIKCSSKKDKEKGKENGHKPLFDPEAACSQYLMAERFVKSILDWKCPIPKEEYQDIANVIIRRLSYIMEYTPIDNGDRISQQMRFLADVISCWISGVLLEVAEDHKKELEEECKRWKQEEEEETEEEEEEKTLTTEYESKKVEEEEEDDDYNDEDEDEDEEIEKEEEEKNNEDEVLKLEVIKGFEEGGGKADEEEAEKKKAEEEEAERKRAEEEEAEKQRIEEEEAERKRAEEEEAEKERVEKEEAERKRLEQEEAEKKRAEEEEAERKRAEEEEAEKLRVEEEVERKRAEEEVERERLEEEAERKRLEEEEAEKIRLEEEEAERKKLEEEEAERIRLEEEKAEAKRLDEERLRLEEEEAQRKRAEEEAVKIPIEEEAEDAKQEKSIIFDDSDIPTDISISKTKEFIPIQIGSPIKVFQSDLPFVTFIKVFNTIYSMIEKEKENSGSNIVINRLHRAVYEKFYNAVHAENPNLLSDHAKDVIDVMSGKIATWLSKVLSESQVLLLEKYPPEVESKEVRDWSNWIDYTTVTAANWSVWLQRLIKDVKKMQDGKVTRGQWEDFTQHLHVNAFLWRRFHLDTVHKAHHNVMMIKDREVVKSGKKKIPEYPEKELNVFNLE